MTKSLFVTGGSGYLGKRFLGLLDPSRFRRVVVLQRQGTIEPKGEMEVVAGDLLDPKSYRSSIDGDTMIVHLAALTGKGTRAAHMEMNLGATKALLAAAQSRGAREFFFVSSIAAGFENRTGYHYADAKALGEKAVQESGLAHLIVRPTMIFGPSAPVLEGLGKLASAPLVPVFGGGANICQPIDVDDMAKWLVFALENIVFDGDTYALGGPDKISMRALLQKIRIRKTGKEGGLVTAPLGLIRFCLQLLEGPLLPFLPLTAGQLASFANDSVAEALPRDLGGHLISTHLEDMMSPE